jgi:hypothetical protein
MIDLKRLFARETRTEPEPAPTGDADSNYHPSGAPGGDGLEVEYQNLIANQFRRWGIKPACVTIEVRKIGQAPDGFDVLVGMVRLTRWERISSIRVMLGLPLLENRVRKALRATWLADLSHFGGLWLRASERLQADPGIGELHQVLMQLVPPSAAPGTRGPSAPG